MSGHGGDGRQRLAGPGRLGDTVEVAAHQGCDLLAGRVRRLSAPAVLRAPRVLEPVEQVVAVLDQELGESGADRDRLLHRDLVDRVAFAVQQAELLEQVLDHVAVLPEAGDAEESEAFGPVVSELPQRRFRSVHARAERFGPIVFRVQGVLGARGVLHGLLGALLRPGQDEGEVACLGSEVLQLDVEPDDRERTTRLPVVIAERQVHGRDGLERSVEGAADRDAEGVELLDHALVKRVQRLAMESFRGCEFFRANPHGFGQRVAFGRELVARLHGALEGSRGAVDFGFQVALARGGLL